MSTIKRGKVTEREAQARVKMAAFIDHTIDLIESTPVVPR